MSILYLHDETARAFAQTVCEEAGRTDLECALLPEGDLTGKLMIDTETHLLVSGSVETLKRVLLFASQHRMSLGILPLNDQSRLAKVLALPKKPDERFDAVTLPSDRPVDLLLCNDIPVLGDARIGENSLLKAYEFDTENPGWSGRIRQWIHTWKTQARLRHHRFTLSTEKEEKITLSAVGLIAMNHNNQSLVAHALHKELGAADGQLALIALAPTSLFEFFIAYPIRLAWRRWQRDSSLPGSWGHLKSSRVEVRSHDPLDVLIDDTETLQTPVTFRIEHEALRLSVGDAFWETQSASKGTRDTVRLAGVPRGEDDRIDYFERGLPLFAHASREQYATLFGALREETQLNWTFVILLTLSTVLATLGLFINSASVIIGAMLLAPLMQPIVGLSMGVLRRDMGLLMRGARSITVGVALVLSTAMTIAQLTPMHNLGSEMAARLSPTILDMLVAIASGIAAAYAKNNPKISGSLVGVAIAVALVPPLAVSGIGIGWGSLEMFSSAMLLFLTNLVGIVLAASLTFFILGFSPIRIAKRGIVIWGMVALLIAIPLYQSFDRMRTRAEIRQSLSLLRFEYNGQSMEIGRVEYLPGDVRPQVRCEVVVDRTLGASERAYIREMIEKVVGRSVETIVTVRYRL
jgi:uncharacterized hydrophobic protein (TIGR00271 family)